MVVMDDGGPVPGSALLASVLGIGGFVSALIHVRLLLPSAWHARVERRIKRRVNPLPCMVTSPRLEKETNNFRMPGSTAQRLAFSEYFVVDAVDCLQVVAAVAAVMRRFGGESGDGSFESVSG